MTIKRKFILGEEWLYIKLYSGPKVLENILVNEIYDLVKYFYSENLIDKFFFVRYMEDGYHLRLRFHITNTHKISVLLNKASQVFKVYVDNRIISHVIYDTYSRELERYGTLSIDFVESIFSANSLQLLELLKSTDDYSKRWLKGIKIMDQLLEKFNLNLQDKHILHESYFQMYAIEFGSSKLTMEILKKKYRDESKKIELMLTSTSNDFPCISNTEILMCKELDTAVEGLIHLKEKSLLEIPLDALVKSLMHMHYNRLFRIRQRFHEFVLYYMLSNSYKSLHIRRKNESNATH